MNLAFADTYYFLALVSSKDESHERALAFSRDARLETLTTAWVLAEVADGLASQPRRAIALKLLDSLRSNPRMAILPAEQDQFERGLKRFRERPDKEWSLTDFISFVVMEEHGIQDALTADHHFGQAGFNVLLK